MTSRMEFESSKASADLEARYIGKIARRIIDDIENANSKDEKIKIAESFIYSAKEMEYFNIYTILNETFFNRHNIIDNIKEYENKYKKYGELRYRKETH